MSPVRRAGPPDRAPLGNVLDGAALAVNHEDLVDRLLAEDVYLFEADGSVLGALVVQPPTEGVTGTSGTTGTDGNSGGGEPVRIAAIAVRRRRRGQGIGTALIEAAAAEIGTLVAEFDADLVPFYEHLGFELEPLPGGRCRGRLQAQTGAPE
ncbi:MAG: GNAT family N-acetyltransferase [Haloarculaceae archaeon]